MNREHVSSAGTLSTATSQIVPKNSLKIITRVQHVYSIALVVQLTFLVCQFLFCRNLFSDFPSQ